MKSQYNRCNLIIKNLPKQIDDRLLYKLCQQFGDVKSAKISTASKFVEIVGKDGVVIDTQFVYESKGFGFVLFKTPEEAFNVLD